MVGAVTSLPAGRHESARAAPTWQFHIARRRATAGIEEISAGSPDRQRQLSGVTGKGTLRLIRR